MKKIYVFLLILLALIFAGIPVKARGNFDVPGNNSGSANLSPDGVGTNRIMIPLTLSQIFDTQLICRELQPEMVVKLRLQQQLIRAMMNGRFHVQHSVLARMAIILLYQPTFLDQVLTHLKVRLNLKEKIQMDLKILHRT